MWLDLRRGAKVRLSQLHNHQGAKQPSTIHVGSRKGQKFHGKPMSLTFLYRMVANLTSTKMGADDKALRAGKALIRKKLLYCANGSVSQHGIHFVFSCFIFNHTSL